jgi:integrase
MKDRNKDPIKFTDTKIKSSKAIDGKRTEYYDTVVTGLILRVTKTGYKSFAIRYWYNDQSKQFTIGKYGDITLAQARSKARELKQIVADGKDPLKQRKNEREKSQEMTFKELSGVYDGIHLPTLRESSRNYHTWAMDTKVLPVLGKMNLKEITQKDIVRLLDGIAIEGGAKATANKVRSRLHHMFEFGRSRSYVEDNPVSDTKPYEGGNNESERYYTADEIKNIWQTIEGLNEPVRSYLKIILLTGQRRTETHMMQWKDIQRVKDEDFEGWVWTIPKQYAKSNRDHIVPLSPLALDILNGLKNDTGNPFVFSSILNNDIPIGLKTIKRATKTIRDDSEVSDYRLHDTRRTVATWLAKLGTPAEVVSKVLNHKTGGGGSLVTRIYNRYEYRKERQTALNKWAYELQRIITGSKSKIIGKIG